MKEEKKLTEERVVLWRSLRDDREDLSCSFAVCTGKDGGVDVNEVVFLLKGRTRDEGLVIVRLDATRESRNEPRKTTANLSRPDPST